MPNPEQNGLVIAAPESSSGKTLVSLGIMNLLQEEDYAIQPFKVGPDYIDPAYHEFVTGTPSINLDPWMTSPSFVKKTFAHHNQNSDLSVVEGVMGLFDGKAGGGEEGSTAQVAKLLNLPVLLILDAGKMARSAAAVLLGFEQFDPDLNLMGVLLNNVGGEHHANIIREDMEQHCQTPLIGFLPKRDRYEIKERHLGLISVHEQPVTDETLNTLTRDLRNHTRLADLIVQPRNHSPAGPTTQIPNEHTQTSSAPVRIGVARDASFCFYYVDNLRLLREAGADLIEFSPAEDTNLPPDLQGLYFGGGFPETFASRLSGNKPMKEDVHQFSGPILAECGGLIYLSEAFFDRDGHRHEMVGRVPGTLEMHDQLSGFGYREVQLNETTLLGPAGTRLRGHLFHYSRWKQQPPDHVGVFEGEKDQFGYHRDSLLASYFHVHFGSRPEAARSFVNRCRS